MKLRQLLPTMLLTLLAATTPAVAKEWRGIVPLHSTRSDVERLIGSKAVNCGSRSCIYDLGDQTVFVLYADEPTCKNDGATTAWRVPRDTVIEIGVHFTPRRPLSDFGFDLTKYEKVEDRKLPGRVYYKNFEEGFEIEVSGTNVVGLNYYQAGKDNVLRCPSAKPQKP